jgi:hypothetical protein
LRFNPFHLLFHLLKKGGGKICHKFIHLLKKAGGKTSTFIPHLIHLLKKAGGKTFKLN